MNAAAWVSVASFLSLGVIGWIAVAWHGRVAARPEAQAGESDETPAAKATSIVFTAGDIEAAAAELAERRTARAMRRAEVQIVLARADLYLSAMQGNSGQKRLIKPIRHFRSSSIVTEGQR